MVIREGRLLPGLIAGFALVVGGTVLVFATDAASHTFGIGMALLGVWPAYRAIRPRWILELKHGNVRFNNVSKNQTMDVPLTGETTVICRQRTVTGVGAEGGIGFVSELIIRSGSGETILPLPFLEMTASSACELVREAIADTE